MTNAVMNKPAAAAKPGPRATKPAGDAPKPASKPADVPSASVEDAKPAPSSDSRYPADEVREAIAKRLQAAHAAGWQRPRISAEVAEEGGNMGGSALWRTAKGNVHVDEVAYLTAVLDKIDAGTLTLPEKVSKDPSALKGKIQAALDLLATSGELKKVGELRELITQVQDALGA